MSRAVRTTLSCFVFILLMHVIVAQEPAAFDSLYSIQYRNQLNGSILIAEKGKIVYQKSSGMADFDKQILNNTATPFNLASVSKVITSTAILQLM